MQVVLDADVVPEACPIGTLYHASGRGGGVFSFAYNAAWLLRPDAFEIDPGLQLVGGESYFANAAGVFRLFLDPQELPEGLVGPAENEAYPAQFIAEPV